MMEHTVDMGVCKSLQKQPKQGFYYLFSLTCCLHRGQLCRSFCPSVNSCSLSLLSVPLHLSSLSLCELLSAGRHGTQMIEVFTCHTHHSRRPLLKHLKVAHVMPDDSIPYLQSFQVHYTKSMILLHDNTITEYYTFKRRYRNVKIYSYRFLKHIPVEEE